MSARLTPLLNIYSLSCKIMKINLISVARDVEGWIAPFVLQKAGFNINIPRHPYYHESSDTLYTLWYQTKHEYPVVLCTHSVQDKGVITRMPSRRQSPKFMPHAEFFQTHPLNNQMLHLWTCFCDFETGQPTNYINLPGFDHQGRPGYFAVLEQHKSAKYRNWLGIVMQHHFRYPEKAVDLLFSQIVSPRLKKYETVSKKPWLFFPISCTCCNNRSGS